MGYVLFVVIMVIVSFISGLFVQKKQELLWFIKGGLKMYKIIIKYDIAEALKNKYSPYKTKILISTKSKLFFLRFE